MVQLLSSNELWVAARELEACRNTMRPYQLGAWRAAAGSLSNRRHVQVISLPTGAGKTLVAAALAIEHLRKNPGKQVLWLAPRWELLAQSAVGTPRPG